ncbi:hypothetical protein GCM10008179_02520 [Hansschlegelia plantiphila]|uniref:Flp family type IVb pilin n=2 Tax=Hansschlegelia plantiphila TaxID=374655 RepID=A0A9W6IZN3_9HYPH|nr:hypothetical protein GCM10008179_02520 [Hansschlegelia plantiphila]
MFELFRRTDGTGAVATSVNQEIFQMSMIKRFANDESGATAIEYGLIAVGIAIAIITMVKGVGGSLNSAFDKVNTNLNN